MKHVLIGVLLTLLTSASFANDQYLVATLASYHANRSSGECEFNPGLLIQNFHTGNWFSMAGVFRNSPCNTAAAAFIGWESEEKKRFGGVHYGFGAMVGISSGYDSVLTGAPYLRFGDRDDRVAIKAMGLPHPTQGVYGISLSVRLGE